MKFAAAILALMVLLASAFPIPPTAKYCEDTVSACHRSDGKHCSEAPHNCAHEKSDHSCPNGACSPFAMCNCYPAILPINKGLAPAYYTRPVKKLILFKEEIYSAFLAECWHPPEHI